MSYFARGDASPIPAATAITVVAAAAVAAKISVSLGAGRDIFDVRHFLKKKHAFENRLCLLVLISQQLTVAM
jgi:hypothetical protein